MATDSEIAAFEGFKFQIGEAVRHRATRMSSVIIGRCLFQSPEGIARAYTLSDGLRRADLIFEIEIDRN